MACPPNVNDCAAKEEAEDREVLTPAPKENVGAADDTAVGTDPNVKAGEELAAPLALKGLAVCGVCCTPNLKIEPADEEFGKEELA